METATKPRLNVMNGGGNVFAKALYLKGWRIQNGYRHFKTLKVVTDHVLDILAIDEMEETGDIDKIYAELATLFTNPYTVADMVNHQDTQIMIARLYRGGLSIEDIARVMHHWHYRDYPFPSRSVKR